MRAVHLKTNLAPKIHLDDHRTGDQKLFIHLIHFLLTLSPVFACVGDYYAVPAGVSQTIDECGTCQIVTNGSANKILVPTKTTAEWAAFRANVTANTGGTVTLNACGSICTYPLDTLPTPGAAYSVRRLRSAYSGPLIRVRRSSDNAELDINASGTGCGDLDIIALTAFAGANSAFVKTWYDQSGNGHNVSQTVNGNQPRIVNSGTLDVINGARAGLRWIGSIAGQMLVATAPFPSSGELTVNMVHKEVGRKNSWAWMLATDSDPGGRISTHMAWGDGRIYWDIGGCCGSPNRIQTTMPVSVGSTNVFSFVSSASASSRAIYANGTSFLTGTPVTSTVSRINLGSTGANAMNGMFGEFLVFPNLLTSGERRTIELSQKTYYSTP